MERTLETHDLFRGVCGLFVKQERPSAPERHGLLALCDLP